MINAAVIIVICITVAPVLAYDKEMTIHIDSGKKDCLYHKVLQGETIEIEYQVIDGGHGDLDISFTLLDPIGLVIVSDFKKSDNIHRHLVTKEGDYRFCFDNTFSSFNRKTVFFELIVEKEGAENEDQELLDVLSGLTPEEYYDMKVNDINDYIARIRMQITKARQLQDLIKSHEARDRNLAEANFNKVNLWSMFQMLTMIIVGLLQVFMLRSIFETDSRVNKIMHKLSRNYSK